MTAPLTESVMRFLALHVRLTFFASPSNTVGSDTLQSDLIDVATRSLEHVANDIGTRAKHLCRTVCAMISWAAVLLLRVSRFVTCDHRAEPF